MPSRKQASALVFSAGLTLIGLLAILGWNSLQFRRFTVATGWTLHSFKAQEAVDQVRTQLLEVDTIARRYSHTGSKVDRAALDNSARNVLDALSQLQLVTEDNSDQQKRIKALRQEFTAWRARPITPGSPQKFQAGIFPSFSVIAHEEIQLSQSRKQEQQRVQESAMRAVIVGGTLAGLLAMALTIIGAWSSLKLRRAVDRLKDSNQRLHAEAREKKSAEDALRESERRFRLLAESSVHLIARLNTAGEYLYASPSARVVLGVSPESLLGTSCFDVVHPGDRVNYQQAFEDVATNHTRRDVVLRKRDGDGKYRWIDDCLQYTCGENGVTGEIQSTSRDVTERRTAEERQSRLVAGLRAMASAGDELLRCATEDQLLRRAVELGRERLGLVRCSIFLLRPDGTSLQGTYGISRHGSTVDERGEVQEMGMPWREHPASPPPGARWRLTDLSSDSHGLIARPLPILGGNWIAATLLASPTEELGVLYHGPGDTGTEHDPVQQELLLIFVSLLGAVLERVRSEERRRRSEGQLLTVMETAPLMFYAVNTDERYIVAMGRGFERVGVDPESLAGRHIDEFADPATSEIIRKVLRGEDVASTVHLREDVWFEVLRRPFYDSSGAIGGMIGVGLDVSDRFRADLARAETEERYRQVVEHATEVFFLVNEGACWQMVNPAWTEIMGYEPDETLGTKCVTTVHPGDREAFERNLQSLIRGEREQVHADFRFIARNGVTKYLDMVARSVKADKGSLVFGTLTDITERKETYNKLLSSTALQDAILNSAVYTIISTDRDGTILSFNRAAEELLGYSASEVVGLRNPAFLHDPEEIRAHAARLSEEFGRPVAPGFEAFVYRSMHGGVDEREWTYIAKDGRRFPVRLTVTSLRGPDGEITGFVGIAYDLSESKRVEALKNEFVSVVSHELRTPLTSIRGALGLLAGGIAGELPPKAAGMIEIARKNSERLVLLINDILDVEKIESGKMRFTIAPVSVASLATQALEANRHYALSLNVQLNLLLHNVSGQAVVAGDEDRLMQVLANLISNACKFTPPTGEVSIIVEVCLDDSRGPRARFSVRDQGPGVPEEFLPRLFEKFAQADASSTRQQGGTGLGLAIARAIVERHGGLLSYVKPSEGQTGATFRFELPLVGPQKELQGRPDQRPVILVCEDDEDMAERLRLLLDEAGYATRIATTVSECKVALSESEFMGMTLDLMLPDGDGMDILQFLKGDARLKDLPVVMISVVREPEEVAGQALSVVDWLHKPIDADRLRGALSTFASRVGRTPRVLHVEDDLDVREVTAAIVGHLAQMVAAENLAEARDYLAHHSVDLVILDEALPDGSGLDLVPQLNAMVPPVPVILFSARELDRDSCEAGKLAAALVKSRTSNTVLYDAVRRLIT